MNTELTSEEKMILRTAVVTVFKMIEERALLAKAEPIEADMAKYALQDYLGCIDSNEDGIRFPSY